MVAVGPETRETIPLRTDDRGAIRVGGTLVTLDVVIESYDHGATPEQIVQKFGELRLDDVYAVITYYLRHVDDVRAYLEKREQEAGALREKVESRPRNQQLRKRLLQRKQDQGTSE